MHYVRTLSYRTGRAIMVIKNINVPFTDLMS